MQLLPQITSRHLIAFQAGCDSTVTLHLTVNTPTEGDTTVTVCGSFSWYEYSDLTQSGDYTHTLTNAAGCDSTVTLHLTVNTPTAGDTTATVCGSFDWHEYSNLTQSGNYTHTLTNAAGCDSTVTLHLTVNESVSTEFSIETNDSCFTWNAETYCESGDYVQTFETSYSCDSTVTLHLTISYVGINQHLTMRDYHINAYPNPTSHTVTIEIDREQAQLTKAEIYDAVGHKVKNINWSVPSATQQIDMEELSLGVYFVRLYNQNEHFGMVKIVKINY